MRSRIIIILMLSLASVTPAAARYVETLMHRDGMITVTGSATVEVVPDEVHLYITIKEYYVEELAGATDPREFKTKVELAAIDKELADAFKKLRVPESAITTQSVGSMWRQVGVDYLKAKQYNITFQSVAEAERVADNLLVRGIESVFMGDLSNRQLPAMREKGKVEALLAAKRKAEVLLKAIGKQLGEVVEIVEPEDQGYDTVLDQAAAMMSNAKYAGNAGAGGRGQRTIPLRYAIRATFKIAE